MKFDLDSTINKLKEAWLNDQPETLRSIFSDAKNVLINNRDHQNLCSLLTLCLKGFRLRQEVVLAAEEAIEMSMEQDEKAMIALYYLIAGKASDRWYYNESDHRKTSDEYFKLALSDPEYLASISVDNYDWLEKGEDSRIFGDDLLSFIGIECEYYDVLYDFYKNTDNRAAACYSRIQMIIKEYGDDEEKYTKLSEVISQYDDLPVVCEAVKYICRHNLLPRPEGEGIEADNEYAEQKYTLIKTYLDRFVDDSHVKELESLIKELENPMFETSYFDQTVTPEKCFSIPVTFRHVESLTVTVYATNLTSLKVEYSRHSSDLDKIIKAHSKPEPIYQKTYLVNPKKPYLKNECLVEVDGLPRGIYRIEMTSNYGEIVSNLLYVSNLIAITEYLPDNKLRIVVVDSVSGHPVPKAKVDILGGGNEVYKTLSCDNQGEIIYKYKRRNNAPSRIRPYTDDDGYCKVEHIWSYYGYLYEKECTHEYTEILTDRGIYRPGQTIHAAFVRYYVDHKKNVKTIRRSFDAQLSIRYRDSIVHAVIKTDEFGVGHYDFIIPEDAETGTYTIRCENSEKRVQIEEYKRPTFEVKLDDYTKPYKVGETITIEGNATSFAGVPISNAEVNYRVKRAAAWWWRFLNPYWEVGGYYGRYGEREYFTGVSKTDENGHFTIDVPMLLTDTSRNNDLSRPMFMNIIAEADVIDTTGEMQNARISLPLSNRDYYMSIQMEEKIEISAPLNFVVAVKNASGKDIEKYIEYWVDDSTIINNVPANSSVSLSGLEIGKHVLHVKMGEEELFHEFLLFDKNACATPHQTEMWSYQSAAVFPENGDDVIIQIGCSDEDTYIIYNLFTGEKLVESGAVMASSGMINRRFSYKKEYGNALLVSYAWVRNKTMQTKNFTISKPVPKRELQLSWETFRDKVTPGSEEIWILSVKDKDGRNVTANVIATLYDKSLDKLAPNQWNSFGPRIVWSVPETEWNYEKIETIWLNYERTVEPISVPYQFNTFKCDLAILAMMEKLRLLGSQSVKYCLCDRSIPSPSIQSAEADMFCCFDSGACSSAEVDYRKSNREVVAEPEVDQFELRSDMSETAFFMPTLRTDGNGNVKIEFKLPDCLTTWKFKAIAHTKDMYHSRLEDETIARKVVMVQPNMPRFVRVGDETTISAKVINTDEKEISGKMVFELLNAADEKVLFSESKPFILAGNAIETKTYQFTPDEEVKDYICRIYAVGDNFSDGEQHPLPVLPNKTEITVTHVISQDGAGIDEIDTAALLPEGSTRKQLSLQYTNSPIWLAVKALPAMTDYDSDNAISIAVSLYCDLLSAHLQERVSKFGDLSITPASNLDKTTKKLISKLEKLQGPSGGFRWFKGMPESLYMTTEIVMHMSRLQKFTGKNFDKLDDVIDRAFGFCDKEMVSQVKELQKREEKGEKIYMPTFTLLQHMYNCAITSRVLSSDAQKAYQYLIPLLKKDIHDQTMREKAMSATILEYAGDHERAKVYTESLRQYTKNDENRGRTFDTPRATFSWYSYKIPTHVAGMEALHMLCPEDIITFKEMQKWLLNEKRTQKWDTPIDSVNAVHALLLDADEYLSNDSSSVFYADGEKLIVDSQGNEGYVETEMSASTRNLKIEKLSKGLSWGAVFAQFLQPISDVESQGSGMTIKREIITDKEELHVGDRIRVRLTYSCERNYDMVTVIDSKAACMEPVEQLSWSDSFKNVSPRDTEVRYSYYGLGQGTHSIETEYYLDRPGTYEIGVATIECTYAPEFRAVCKSQKIIVLR